MTVPTIHALTMGYVLMESTHLLVHVLQGLPGHYVKLVSILYINNVRLEVIEIFYIGK